MWLKLCARIHTMPDSHLPLYLFHPNEATYSQIHNLHAIMVLTSGHYRTLVGNHSLTVPQESNTLTLASSDSVTPISLRRNKDSWLSLDDGETPRHRLLT